MDNLNFFWETFLLGHHSYIISVEYANIGQTEEVV